jgi:two-component system NarL family sensor kinase
MRETEDVIQLHLLVTGSFTLLILSIVFSLLLIIFIRKLREKKSALFNAVLESQEKERKRIGRDLHDEMGPLLSAAKIQLELLKSAEPEDTTVISDFQKLLDEAITGIRISVQDLVPNTLYNFGLIEAVQELCSKLDCSGCKLDFSYNAPVFFDIPDQLNIYRIIQELLNNTIKHAQASKIKIKFIHTEDSFVFTVEDNGIGFKTENAKKLTGIGLKNIDCRVSVLKGKLFIDSEFNKGTFVRIILVKRKKSSNGKIKYYYCG